MPITVELQDMFYYSLWMVMLAIFTSILFVTIGMIAWIYTKKKTKVEMPKPEVQIESKPVKRIVPKEHVKQQYGKMIDDLEKSHRNGSVSNRKAYQQLSVILRRFVNELTGVKVHNYTLEEIKKLNMPNLEHVIEECYTPEFSMESNGDLYNTMNKAKNVIKDWK